MKILLLHTYTTSAPGEFIQTLSEPLGLLSLATYIEAHFKQEVSIKLLDLYADGFHLVRERDNGRLTRGISEEKEIIRIVLEEGPDIVGIHCNFTGYASDAMEVAAIVKKASPRAVLVMGGAHASYDSENILKKHSCIDYIVRGEGEITFYELIQAVKNGARVNAICGITYRGDDGSVVMTPERELVKDIDTLGIPDRKYIDMEKYKYLNRKSLPACMNYPVATVMASRGCPYNCVFCSTKNMWKRLWRGRSAQSIISEIENLHVHYGIKEVVFYDDQFTVNKDWVHQICDLIIERKMNISLALPSGVSVWMVDEALLRKMKKAGFYRLHLPIESGNARTIAFIRKQVDLNSVLNIIRLSCKIGYWTTANFIIGFPYETKEEIEETIRFAYACGIDYPFFFIARPYAGSEMYEIYKKEGLLDDSAGLCSSVFVAKSDTLQMTAGELNKIRTDAEKQYLSFKFFWCLNPKNFIGYILPRFTSLRSLNYLFKLFKLFVSGKHKRA